MTSTRSPDPAALERDHTGAAVRGGTPRTRRRSWWPYLFALPAVAALAFGFLFPLVSVVRNSLYAGTFYDLQFVGLGNFKALLTDDASCEPSPTTSGALLLTVPLMTVLALLIALSCSSANPRE